MDPETPRSLAEKLDDYNQSEDAYNLLSKIFIPFDNNLGNSSHMELFARAIESIKEDIKAFRNNPSLLSSNITHISGLNDGNETGTFYLIDRGGSLNYRLKEAIGFTKEDVDTLKQMLVRIKENKLWQMKQEL